MMNHSFVAAIDGHTPQIHDSVLLSPGVSVIGAVELKQDVSVWFNSVIRGDNDRITVGARSNIQDACVLHTDPGFHLQVGEDVSVGHQSMLHGCKIGNGSLIGIQSVLLNGSQIGEYCLIGAKSLIAEGKVIPPRSLVVGSPGRVLRELNDDEVALLERSASGYVDRARAYRSITAVAT